jgi:hypothetical protein
MDTIRRVHLPPLKFERVQQLRLQMSYLSSVSANYCLYNTHLKTSFGNGRNNTKVSDKERKRRSRNGVVEEEEEEEEEDMRAREEGTNRV